MQYSSQQRSSTSTPASWQGASISERGSLTPAVFQSSSTAGSSSSKAKDDAERNLRVFGGSSDEAGSTELCGPMLDVVLGLFGGIDYED